MLQINIMIELISTACKLLELELQTRIVDAKCNAIHSELIESRMVEFIYQLIYSMFHFFFFFFD